MQQVEAQRVSFSSFNFVHKLHPRTMLYRNTNNKTETQPSIMAARSKWTKAQYVEDSDSDDDMDGGWDCEMPMVVEPTSDQSKDWPWIQAITHKLQIEDMPIGVPVEIIPGKLYIGDAQCVRENYKKCLQKHNISAVLNIAAVEGTPADPKYLAAEWKEAKERGTFLYKAISADDHPTYPLLENHWQEAEQFIVEAHRMDRPTLVHCVAGQNRSALIVCAYYMVHTQTTLVKTVEHVRLHRGTEVLKNIGFKWQLVQMARRQGLLGTSPLSPELAPSA